MKHTKGKWFNNGGRIYAQQGDDIREICDVGIINNQSVEDTANARLISSAPDLLQALKDLQEQAEDANNKQHAGIPISADIWSAMYSAQNAAKAAIVKAETF